MVLNSQTTMQESYVLEHELLAASIATHSVRQSIGNKRGSLFSEILSSTSDECSATTGMPAWDRCRVLLDEALSLDGDLACAYGVMGLTYLQQYQRDPSVDASSRVDLLQKAKQQFEIALRLIPSEYHALLGYAELLSLRQEDDAAERMFSRANSIYPQDANILELMGNHYLSRKKWKEAAKAYSQHIQACVQSFGPETHQSAKRTPFAPVAPDTPVLSFAASEDEEGYADAQNALVALQQGLVSPDLLYRRGLARAGMRLFREAAQDFSKCLSALEPLYGASDVETITVNGMSFYPALLQIQYDYICALFAGGLYAECVKELSRVDWQSFVDRSTVMHMLVTSFKNLDDKANMSRVLLWDFHQLWMQNPVRDVHDIGELRSARQFSDLSYSSSVILALFSGHPQSLLQVKDQIPEADILLGNYDAAMSRNERALDMFVYHSARYRLRKWLHQSGVSDDPTAEDMIIASLDPLSEKRLIETFLWQPPSEIVSYSRARFGRDSLEHRTWFFLHALSRLRAGDDSPMLQLDQLIATGNEDAVVEWTACRMALLADNDFRTGKKDEAFSVLAKALDMVFFAFPPFFVLRASWYFSDLNFRECYSNCILALKLNDQDVSARLLAAKSALKFTTEDQVIRRYADELLVVSTELPTCSAVQAILGDVFSKLGSIEKAKYHWEQALLLELDFYRHWRGTGPDSADVHEYSTKLASAMASTGDVAGAERYRVIADSWVGTIPSG
jgi:tetratricopeptide (TPR) repeat protein